MHVQVPDKQTEDRDQRQFDEAVERKGKTLLEWLAGAGILAALLMSAVALVQSGEKSPAVTTSQPAVKAAATPAPAAAVAATKTVDLKIIGGVKPGPEGQKHDAFTTTEFAVHVGQPLKLKIDNTDDVPHSINAPLAGVDIIAQPGTHTYTLIVSKAGKFFWICTIPCDSDAHGWAMQHAGFMAGYITAT